MSGDLDLTLTGAASKGDNAILFAFYQLFRTAQIHAIDNQALGRPIQMMFELTSQIFHRDGHVALQVKDRSLFLNGTRLKLTSDEYELANRVVEFFRDRGMIGFEIDGPLTPDNIRKLLQILVYGDPEERTFKTIDAALRSAGIPFHPMKPLFEQKKAEEETTDLRRLTFSGYAKIVALYRALADDAKATGAIRQQSMRKIARTVQRLVDIAVDDHEPLIAAATSRDLAEYPSHHAANVALLSIALGKVAGIGKIDLADLGVAAIFHDIGLRACPAEVLEKGGALDSHERAVINQHPIRSVEFLLEDRRFTKAALSRIVVAFEHHRNPAGTGYPPGSRKPDVFSRIVKIADVYDALTSRRPWRAPYLPDLAINMMLRDSGQQFDGDVMKAFVHMMGLYPVGAVVRTDAGEVGVVTKSGGHETRLSRPVILLIDESGRPTTTVDLLDRTPLGAYRRTILRTEDPLTHGIQPSGFLAPQPAA